jgi:hypothetical protein
VLRRNATNLVRVGILVLPLSGFLALAGTLGSYGVPAARVDVRAAAQAASSTGYFVSQLANILSLTALIFGVMALAAYLASTRVRRVALAAMVLSIVGIALILSILGLRAYALPALGFAYLNGQEDAIAIVGIVFDSITAKIIYIVVIVIYSAGFLLFGVAIWGSGVLRKGAAISLALHAPLLSSFIRPQTSLASVVGALLFILGSVLISLGVFQRPFPGEAEPPAR